MQSAQGHLVWLFPLTYLLHLAEELYAEPGFPAWLDSISGIPLSRRAFLGWNGVGLAMMSAGALLATRQAKFRWLEIAISTAVLGNAVAHLAASAITGTYSPGVVTGLLIWMPLGTARLCAGWRHSSVRNRWIGAALGTSSLLVTLAVLVWPVL